MPEFKYEAKSLTGEKKAGLIEADSRQNAAKELVDSGLFVISLKPARGKSQSLLIRYQEEKLKGQYPYLFCRQMAIMLGAGLSINDALKVLAGQAPKSPQHRILVSLSQTIQNGSTLSSAMEKTSTVFSRTVIATIAAGEASGSLDVILTNLADRLQAAYIARTQLRNALIYPIILFAVTLLAGSLIVCFVLPAFAEMFSRFHTTLPLLTRMLLAISSFISSNLGTLLFVLVGTITLSLYLYKRPAIRLKIDRLLLTIPFFGKLRLMTELLNISGTLSVLLKSGIPIDKAIDILQNTTENTCLKNLFVQAKFNLLKGSPLSTSLAQSQIIPAYIIELLAAGEATGEIENVLDRISDMCKFEADNLSEQLKSYAEPAMLLLASAFIIPLILAIALPVLDTVTIFS